MRRALTTILLTTVAMAADDPARPVVRDEGVESGVRVVLVGPMEIRLSYWPTLDEKSAKIVTQDMVGRTIPYYDIQWDGDDPRPRGAPLGRLRIAGARVADQGRSVILATDPHPRRAIYVLDWLGEKADDRPRYLYSGVVETWYDGPEDTPPGSSVIRRNFAMTPPQGGEGLRIVVWPKRVALRATLVVPKAKWTLVLKGNMPFRATIGNKDVEATGEKGKGKPRRAEIALEATGEPIELEVILTTEENSLHWEFAAFWKDGDQEVVIPPSQLALPWLPVMPPAPKAPEPPYRLDGGDPRKGAEVFASEEAKCASCHAIGGKGGAIGPSLDGLKDRDLAMIYRDIAEPSAVIVPEYLTYTVARKDGQIAVGVVRAEGFDAVRVADINGKFTTIPKAEIEEMRPSTTSTMPVGLAGALGEEKMRDLLAFLRSGK